MGDYSQHQAPYLMQNFAYSGGQIGVDVGAGGSVWSTGAPHASEYVQPQPQQYSPYSNYAGSYIPAASPQHYAAGNMWNPAVAAAPAANSYESGDLYVWPYHAAPAAPAHGYAPLAHQQQPPPVPAAGNAPQSANNGGDPVAVVEQGIASVNIQPQTDATASTSDATASGAAANPTKTWAKIAASQAPTGGSTSKPPVEPASAAAAVAAVPIGKAAANNAKSLGKGTGGLATVGPAAAKQQQQQQPRGNAMASMAPGQGYAPQQQQQQPQQQAATVGASAEYLRQLEKDINPTKFEVLDGSEFYVIKSYSEDDIHRAIKYSIWCSTKRGNDALNEAYRRTANRAGAGVYLLFSVNGSGHFCGVAQMTSEVDAKKNAGVWCQDKWMGEFRIRWIYVKDVPNSQLRHIRVAENENKPVTNSRDCTRVPIDQGRQVLSIIRSYRHSTSIFDDFSHYEKRELEAHSPS